MTIETKYNIGKEVWFMNGGEPTSEKIVRIDIERYECKQYIEYTVILCDVIPTTFYEEEVFPTKEELIKSL